MIHEHENNSDTESFLKDNGDKFNNHCVEVLKLLYRGLRLTSRELETKYGMDGRRLRDVYAARKDIKRKWETREDGKRKWVVYFMEIPKPPTKSDVQIFWEAYQNEQPPTITRYTQINLL